MKRNLFTIVLLGVLFVATEQTGANGTKPAGNVPVKAEVLRQSGASDEIFNARLVAGPIQSMEISAKDGDAVVNLRLSKLAKLEFIGPVAESASDTKWKVTAQGEDDGREFILTTGSEKEPVRLKGIRKDGSSFEIPLAKCKEIKLAQQGELQHEKDWPIKKSVPKK